MGAVDFAACEKDRAAAAPAFGGGVDAAFLGRAHEAGGERQGEGAFLLGTLRHPDAAIAADRVDDCGDHAAMQDAAAVEVLFRQVELQFRIAVGPFCEAEAEIGIEAEHGFEGRGGRVGRLTHGKIYLRTK